MNARILVIDDDIPLTKTLERLLNDGGYLSLAAHTAEDGLYLALNEAPDLILLDVMVPNMGGWEVCRRVRIESGVPIIFLTAMGDAENIVRGLEMGGDDYIVKPFNPQVVLARIMAHLRRFSMPDQTNNLVFKDGLLIIDLSAHSVKKQGIEVDLTPREFQLLTVLARNAGRVLTTNELVRNAWGMDQMLARDNIKPYIHYLRKKIEDDPTSPDWIQTVRGIGYRFNVG
ncbi:MAG: response regulator transcription factor [Candidatus Promineifilaceae bacterium]|nr:response regulator transcription factor [Candidatus Promineifilaceae bacterium]